MVRHSSFGVIVRKVEILTVISSLAVLSWAYFSRSQPLKVKVEDSLKAKASPTLDNLQTAYNSEANSNSMYLNFAKQASDEGYDEVAVLFKTLAHAEKVHRDNHAQVIKAMEAKPEKTMIVPQVASTIDQKVDSTNNSSKLINSTLSILINEELAEHQMYAQFIKQAKLDNNLAALKTFETALVAENQHAQMLTQAKGNLDNWELDNHEFYVCQLTGEIFDGHPGLEACSPS